MVDAVERLTADDHAAAAKLLVEAYSDYAERLGPDGWAHMRGMLVDAPAHLVDAQLAGVRAPGALEAVVFYFPPGKSDTTIFPAHWASLRLIGVAPTFRGHDLSRLLVEWCIQQARTDQATKLGLHTSDAMTKARLLYERMGFVVDGDLPESFGLRYWRYRLDL
jgi:GNAT superfamily N-acetyltransferase